MWEFVAEVVLEVVCGMTGYAVLWAVTLGRWGAFERTSYVADLIGLLFWVVVGVGVWAVFFR